ncbi:restriction endonuclease subunit S [Pseudohongiella sp. SYSU M77423]|uniref:restriction endonuclease subunit S n=1 Tax=Pseudohongiella sp. SYSU M77423 TaxID=3042312 RepID=UPI00247FD50E|nr:restriction endonuclease subunit S [Pseudohongiella sp. SYSU M77423]MDH7942526.1 restriction endonuclease subunit S [Pseudohongiella sp. SYSU M77423]
MNNQFSTYQIGEVAEIIAGGDKPKVFSLEKEAPVSIPVLANAEKDNGLMGYTDNARIFEPAVTVAARGSNVGFVAIRKEPFFPVVRLLSLIPKEERLDVDYLFYNLKQNRKTGTGSGQPQITIPDISTKTISLPPISVQKKVARVLSVLDVKIELNKRINAELEAMAKSLYNYWFVQFDFPNANGKPYKTSGGKMVYNPTLKREIPEGWNATPLSKITPVSNQSVNPVDYPNKVFRHFSIPVYDATKTFGLEAGETIGSNKFTVKENDILVSKLNPWFSRVIYAMEEEDLICSTEFVVWRAPNSSIINFLYMVATSPQFIAHCTQSATGTSNSHKRVNPGVMMRFETPFKEEIASALGKKLEPMIKQILINQRENTTLAKLRDWLLPMLMNGQVTVK